MNIYATRSLPCEPQAESVKRAMEDGHRYMLESYARRLGLDCGEVAHSWAHDLVNECQVLISTATAVDGRSQAPS